MIPRDCECFALRVKGDSMINAGIFDGDIVVVREAGDGGKRRDRCRATRWRGLDREDVLHGGRKWHTPATRNPHLRPIITKDAQIMGKVVLTMRQYH
jgi:repressor LexA